MSFDDSRSRRMRSIMIWTWLSVAVAGAIVLFATHYFNWNAIQNVAIPSQTQKVSDPANKLSAEYTQGFTIGTNFEQASLAGSSGKSVCALARDHRMVRINGVPSYISDDTVISFLRTKDGFQGCVEAFGSQK